MSVYNVSNAVIIVICISDNGMAWQMRRVIAITITLLMTSVAMAQTATPTVAPAFQEGFYQAELFSAPQVQLTNATVSSNLGSPTLRIAVGGTIRFRTDAKFLVMYVVGNGAVLQVCVNNINCINTTTGTNEVFQAIGRDLTGISEIKMTVVSGFSVHFDYIVLLQGNIIAAPTSTPGATPTGTPEPTAFLVFVPYQVTPFYTPTPSLSSYVEYEATDEFGEPYTVSAYAVENTVSTGEGVIAVMTMGILAVLLVITVVLLWKL